MLVGRPAECDRLDRLLAQARAGRSGVLALRGEPGIGKSALCAYAVGQAAGFTLLRAEGLEFEAELPFVGLADLLRPVLGRLDEIPAPQADALRSAFALGPPVGGDRFTICAATLSLLAAAAERAPVLAVVDDAQWLDRSSAQALVFAARRLHAERIVLLVALRDVAETPFDRAGLPSLRIDGLDDGDATTLLRTAGRTDIDPGVMARLIEVSNGNPLALLEIPPLLTPEQLAGVAPLEELLPTTEGLERAYLLQVERLPETTRRALVVASTSGSDSFDEVSAAVERAGLGREALDPAEAAGLTSVVDGRFSFRQPILRAAVYRRAPAAQRRAAHEAVAAASDGDSRLWHLAAATDRSDAAIAAGLEGSASEARSRGGHSEAASAFERAARLTDDPDERARLLRDAADEARHAGETERARGLLEDALASTTDATLAARIHHLYGVVEMWSGAAMAAHARLTEEASRIETTDAARAAWLLTDAGWACLMAGEIGVGRATAERATMLAQAGGGFPEILASTLYGITLFVNGDRSSAEPLFDRYRALLDDRAFLERSSGVVWPAGQALLWLEEHEDARAVLTQVVESARNRSAPSLLPYALTGLSELDFRCGAWARAYANATEAVTLARETEQPAALAFALAGLARLEAAQGREDDCRTHVIEALDLAELGVGAVVAFSVAALGLLELGAGRNPEATELLARVAREVRAHGLAQPTVLQWAPDLIEAYARAGRRDEALASLAAFESEAEASTSRWALAASARCRGLLASDESFDADFARAYELHELLPSPFERARTQVCHGERLRRARRRREARGPLRSALEQFERLGASTWAQRARSELDASGETLQRPHAAGVARELTAQEVQVALLAAKGATNREAGAALFLSPKTVEAHLGRVYRKLNVRSRTELAALLARDEALLAS